MADHLGYITSLLMTFVLLGILQMYDMLSNPVRQPIMICVEFVDDS